jgi:hypothetical protein
MRDSFATSEPPVRGFSFEKDTFTFANELIWQYHIDPVTRTTRFERNDPPPTYSHRCFVVVRSARQFFYHARFEPALPAVEASAYRQLIREVVSRPPRRRCSEQDRIVFTGYDCLRAFSKAHEPLLKAECGGPWQSYFLRSHWRMIFPVRRWHQARIAKRLCKRVREGRAPAAHLFRFPRISINHGIMLYALAETERDFQFEAYDPNLPGHPVKLHYDRASRTFSFPPTIYWAGGPVNVIEIFRGGLY